VSKSTVTQNGVPISSCTAIEFSNRGGVVVLRHRLFGELRLSFFATSTMGALFLASGKTATLMGASLGWNLRNRAHIARFDFFLVIASTRNAKVARSAPAQGSIT
jgi:hypothetical protein